MSGRVVESLDGIRMEGPVALTIGTFDGVHRAHAELLEEARRAAKEIGGTSAVLTFQNHPREIVAPQRAPKLLTEWPRKRELLLETGIDLVVGLPFTVEFAQMEAEEFVRGVIAHRLNAKHLISGPAFHFGHRGSGNAALLHEMSAGLGIKYDCREPVMHDGQKVSSTLVRALLHAGDVVTAAEFLGRAHSIDGVVVEGDRIGRTIGFPTANLRVGGRLQLPGDGVYAVRVLHGGNTHNGMMNLGWRPTVGGGEHRIEVHLLDFSGELVGSTLRVEFVRRLRGEQRFGGLEELKEQLGRDREAAQAALAALVNE